LVKEPAKLAAPSEKKRAPRMAATDLLKKAEMLRDNGQLEEALRFYRLAKEAAPERKDIEENIQRLEAEMN
jgi:hypothetical protein